MRYPLAGTNTGTVLVLITGTMTFTNEWLQTKEVNWRIPIATLLGAVVVDGVSKVTGSGGTALGVMILIAGAATPINGKSPIQELLTVLPSGKTKSASLEKVS
jgi:hypothetical protein